MATLFELKNNLKKTNSDINNILKKNHKKEYDPILIRLQIYQEELSTEIFNITGEIKP